MKGGRPVRARLEATDRSRMLRLWQQGLRVEFIAERFGISKDAVWRYVLQARKEAKQLRSSAAKEPAV